MASQKVLPEVPAAWLCDSELPVMVSGDHAIVCSMASHKTKAVSYAHSAMMPRTPKKGNKEGKASTEAPLYQK